jgi:hypothetical protein
MSRRNIPSAAQVRRWQITPPREEQPAPRPLRKGVYDQGTPVRHGYSVADLSRIASFVVRDAARRGMRDLDEKRSAAMCALIETLHAHECDPGSSVLIRAAEDAISRESDRFWSNLGYNSKTKEHQKGFPRYWHHVPATPLDEAVAERVAVLQILAALTDRQQQVVHTLAETGDRRATALALGVDPTTISAVLGNARRAFMALWLEGETPQVKDYRAGRANPYSAEAAAARPEIARRAVRVREQRRAAAREAAAWPTR